MLSSFLLLCNGESDWMSIQPIEVPDRQIHVFPTKLLGGGKFGWGGGGGSGPKKDLQI